MTHSFQLERTSYKSHNLIYKEQGFRLVVYLEMSGVKDYDLVGCDSEFIEWTDPSKLPISESKRIQILERLKEWSQSQNIRIDIGPGIGIDTYFDNLEKAGWKVKRMSDGNVLTIPPKAKNLFNRIVNLFRCFFMAA